jgi:hypothetical protein
MRQVLSTGIAECHYEPQCRHGLEGYSRGDTYRFERMKGPRGRYIRVYPGGMPEYYETIGPEEFLKFFTIKEEHSQMAA